MNDDKPKPEDDLDAFRFSYLYASIFATAGMLEHAIQELEPLLNPPSEVSSAVLELDPAFDRVRERPEFKAFLERLQ